MKKSKTILYLRTDISNQELQAGGSVAHTLGVLNGFLKQGYEVQVASSSMIEALKRIPLAQLKGLKNPSCLSFLRWKCNCLLSNIFFTLSVWKTVRRQKINFIYQRYSLLNASGLLLKKLKKIPLVLEYNGSEAWIEKHWGKNRGSFFFSWLSRWIEEKNLKEADALIVVSQVLKKELVGRGVAPCNILVNPNGVDTEEYDPEKLTDVRAFLRKKLRVEDKFVFGFIGSFSYWHGINVLEYMIPAVLDKEPRAIFLLIGDGPLLPGLKQKCSAHVKKNKVIFTGTVKQKDAKNYLACCDAFLCPTQSNLDGTKFFGSPTKLFEYMSMAKPVIASDLEQISDIIKPAIKEPNTSIGISKEIGMLVNSDQYANFVTFALNLMELGLTYQVKLGENARKRIKHSFSWQCHVNRILFFLKEREIC